MWCNPLPDNQMALITSGCALRSQDHAAAFAQYGTMRDVLNNTGRPVYFSLCGWNPWYAPLCTA